MISSSKRKKLIRAAIDRANSEIVGHAQRGPIAAGLSAEGYNGGYRDALSDVLLLLEGDTVPNRHHFWYQE